MAFSNERLVVSREQTVSTRFHCPEITAHGQRKNAPGFETPGAPRQCERFWYCRGKNLLMTSVVLVAIDLARRAVLLAVDLLALLRR